MSATSKSGDRSSRKTSKATVIEESVLTINLTVSPAAPVARASIKYPVKLVRLRDISIDGLLRLKDNGRAQGTAGEHTSIGKLSSSLRI